jgi:hypothetical protein
MESSGNVPFEIGMQARVTESSTASSFGGYPTITEKKMNTRKKNVLI